MVTYSEGGSNMKIIVKTVAGSHLFGTNTASSDRDFKGVFLPSRDQILLGEGKDTQNTTTGSSFSKNNSNDVDVELYSLKKFMKMLSTGDTAALEILFSPKEMIIESTPEWDYIVSHRDQLVHKNVQAILGYARSQANKYGIRGSRMGELGKFLKDIKDLNQKHPNMKMKVVWNEVIEICKGYEHIFIETIKVTTGGEGYVPCINILGAKFDHHTKFEMVAKNVSDKYKEFGQRSREASKNNGIDYKACSHAVRVSLQAKELLSTGQLTMPHSGDNLNRIMRIKSGKEDWKFIANEIETLLDEVSVIAKSSTLQENINEDVVKDIIKTLHLGIINV